jgi:D-sedoheptulose 7-phosphate isomerase
MEEYNLVVKNFKDSVNLKQKILTDENVLNVIVDVSKIMIETFKNGGKLLFCGNGGSAADAQHLAAEFSGRYYFDRPPLYAEALHVNTSYITAVANDYSYNEVFSRIVNAMGSKNDVLIALSTSGNSYNVINALKMAKSKGLLTVGLTGKGGGKMKSFCDFIIEIPSSNTPRIQECHMLIGHSLCEIVENKLFQKK